MKRWLYRYEVKGIQDWILNTDKLVEIKGGSALIEGLADLARGLIGALGLGEVGRELQAEDRVVEVMAAAGSATYIFPSREHVATFAAHWPMAVERHAPGIQVVQAWQQGEDKSALDSLFASLGAARNRVPVRLPEAGPLLLRAGRTGSPAVLRSKKHGLLDAATAAKRQQGEPSAGPARRGADPLEKLLGTGGAWCLWDENSEPCTQGSKSSCGFAFAANVTRVISSGDTWTSSSSGRRVALISPDSCSFCT